MGFQEFLDLLQRSGEEAGLMDLQKEEFDDWVPASVVRCPLTPVPLLPHRKRLPPGQHCCVCNKDCGSTLHVAY